MRAIIQGAIQQQVNEPAKQPANQQPANQPANEQPENNTPDFSTVDKALAFLLENVDNFETMKACGFKIFLLQNW